MAELAIVAANNRMVGTDMPCFVAGFAVVVVAGCSAMSNHSAVVGRKSTGIVVIVAVALVCVVLGMT